MAPHDAAASAHHLERPTWAQRPMGRRPLYLGVALAAVYAVGVLFVSITGPGLGLVQFFGAPILSVAEGTPAARAGLQAGDVLTSIGGVDAPDPLTRHQLLLSLPVDQRVDLEVSRDGATFSTSIVTTRPVLFRTVAALAVGILLLLSGLLADRGRGGHARAYFWNTVCYAILAAGAFSLEAITLHAELAAPWIASMFLAPACTCHFLLMFPLGRSRMPRRALALLYVPPVLATCAMIINGAVFEAVGGNVHGKLSLAFGLMGGLLAVIYLTAGSAALILRVRRRRSEIDPVALPALYAAGAFVAGPFAAGIVWAAVDPVAFVAGGFSYLIAVTLVGGALSLSFAMTRIRFGQLDRLWRRSGGTALALLVLAAIYLGVAGAFGGGSGLISTGNAVTAVGATLVAYLVFGPLRARLQASVDTRFRCDRRRARRLVSEAAEVATHAPTPTNAQRRVVAVVADAMSARGAGIYALDAGGWSIQAARGELSLPAEFGAEHPAWRALAHPVPRDAAHRLGGAIAVPLPGAGAEACALVVEPEPERGFDDEERELLVAAAVSLGAALDSQRARAELLAAQAELERLSGALRRESDAADRRRREITLLKHRVGDLNAELIHKLAGRGGRAPVIGSGLRPTFELVHKAAPSGASILVSGETGVGKELVARAVHAASPRADGPLVVIDCGAISPGLFESTLFGHVRGAFTGATSDSPGAFRAAHGGTVFLDEIGELPLELQPKLLRALQEREVHPVGAHDPVKVDVRVIAGTHRDLAARVDSGEFRQDLLYRLQVVTIAVPPLRARRGDIAELAEHFLAGYAERAGIDPPRIEPDARKALLEYDWPGNVRELENCLEAAIVYSDGHVITTADLPIFEGVIQQRGRRAITNSELQREHGAPRAGLRNVLDGLERDRIAAALKENGGNKAKTARALGMSRGALLRRLRRYEIAMA